jgi:hypothetical protein
LFICSSILLPFFDGVFAGEGYHLDAKTRTPSKWLTANKGNQEAHQKFMRSVKHWIKKKVDNPERRVKDKGGLRAAQTVDAVEERGRSWLKDSWGGRA